MNVKKLQTNEPCMFVFDGAVVFTSYQGKDGDLFRFAENDGREFKFSAEYVKNCVRYTAPPSCGVVGQITMDVATGTMTMDSYSGNKRADRQLLMDYAERVLGSRAKLEFAGAKSVTIRIQANIYRPMQAIAAGYTITVN